MSEHEPERGREVFRAGMLVGIWLDGRAQPPNAPAGMRPKARDLFRTGFEFGQLARERTSLEQLASSRGKTKGAVGQGARDTLERMGWPLNHYPRPVVLRAAFGRI